MKCSDARKVWGHPQGFLEGLRSHFPEVLPRLERIARGLVKGSTNPFHEGVRRKVNLSSPGCTYLEHAEDNDPVAEQVHDVVGDAAANILLGQYFSKMFGQTIVFSNLCCGGCGGDNGRLSEADIIAIQEAAVRTDVDGSDILL